MPAWLQFFFPQLCVVLHCHFSNPECSHHVLILDIASTCLTTTQHSTYQEQVGTNPNFHVNLQLKSFHIISKFLVSLEDVPFSCAGLHSCSKSTCVETLELKYWLVMFRSCKLSRRLGFHPWHGIALWLASWRWGNVGEDFALNEIDPCIVSTCFANVFFIPPSNPKSTTSLETI